MLFHPIISSIDISPSMDATVINTVSTLSTSITQRTSKIPNMHCISASRKDFFTTLSDHYLRHTLLTLSHCSRKPNVTVESNSNLKTQIETTPTSNEETLSSSSPCSNSSSSRGLVFDLGTINSWDSAELGSPVVKRFLGDEEERWYMWYHGKRDEGNLNPDSVGLAFSSNGIHWERGTGAVQSSSEAGLVLNCSKDWWAFDTESIRPSEVVIMSSAKVRASSAVYWLYYTGFISKMVEDVDSPLGSKVLKSLPGLAISQDGRYWARIEGEHHTGALFDVGSKTEWDSTFISSPYVVFHEKGDLRMYYHSFDVQNGHFAIGLARSRDGIKWVKLGKILGGGLSGGFDEFGVMNACVVRNRKEGKEKAKYEYVMVYEGVGGDGKSSIGLAVSTDGLTDWRRVQDEAILNSAREAGWDNEGVGSPCLVQMDGGEDEWRLYYRGIGDGGRSGIGMAVSQGSELTSFTRWTGFHL